MEVKREPLGPAGQGSPNARLADGDLRVQRLNAEQLLRGGEIEGRNQSAHLKGTGSNSTSRNAS